MIALAVLLVVRYDSSVKLGLGRYGPGSTFGA